MGLFRTKDHAHLVPIHTENAKSKDWVVLLEASTIEGEVAEERSGVFGEDEMFGGRIGAEPGVFAEDREDIDAGEEVDVSAVLGDVVVGHGVSLT